LIEVELLEFYRCPPSVLDEQDWDRIQEHMIALDVRAQYNKRKK